MQGTKRNYTKPVFRGNSSRDPADHLKAGQDGNFDKCSVPIVWWPWWPFNFAGKHMISFALYGKLAAVFGIEDLLTF